jgi:hypothetical protein
MDSILNNQHLELRELECTNGGWVGAFIVEEGSLAEERPL